MTPVETRVPISEQIFGHNKAPLAEVLAKDFKELASRVDAAVAKIGKRPVKVKDETDFAAVGQLVLDARNLAKEIDSIIESSVPLRAHAPNTTRPTHRTRHRTAPFAGPPAS